MTMSFLVMMIYHLLSLQKGEALPSPLGLDLLLLVVEILDSCKPCLHLYPQYLVLVNLGIVHVKGEYLLILIMSMGIGTPPR